MSIRIVDSVKLKPVLNIVLKSLKTLRFRNIKYDTVKIVSFDWENYTIHLVGERINQENSQLKIQLIDPTIKINKSEVHFSAKVEFFLLFQDSDDLILDCEIC